MHSEKKKNVLSELKQIKLEFALSLKTLIISAFALIAALAWNDLVKKLLDKFFQTEDGSIRSQLIYAMVITIITVLVSYYLGRFVAGRKIEKEQEE